MDEKKGVVLGLDRRGFSLFEIMAVLAIVGIGIGLFYSVFFINWVSFEKEITAVDLQMEADGTLEPMAADIKYSRSFSVLSSGRRVRVDLPDGSSVTYDLTGAGEIQRTSASSTRVLSDHVDVSVSSFRRVGNYLLVELTFSENVLNYPVTLTVSTQVYPRNT